MMVGSPGNSRIAGILVHVADGSPISMLPAVLLRGRILLNSAHFASNSLCPLHASPGPLQGALLTRRDANPPAFNLPQSPRKFWSRHFQSLIFRSSRSEEHTSELQ